MNFGFLSTAAEGAGSLGFSVISIVLMLGLLYFIMIRPQQKRDKQALNMRNSIEVGDSVTTIGGIVGRVASLKEDTFVLETGSDRVKLRFKRSAIGEVEKLVLETATDNTNAKQSNETAKK